MNRWLDYWNASAQVRDADPLRQVGKTVAGQPITADQMDALVGDIRHHLELTPDDELLDLCCGNGAVTARVAPHCRHVTGVDFSAPLLAVANSQYAALNVDFVQADVCLLPEPVRARRFDKVVMYEALQHFDAAQLGDVLDGLDRLAVRPRRMLLGSVPDARRKWNFYDTEARRAEYDARVASGKEPIGTWWKPDELQAILRLRGWRVAFAGQSPALHGVHYRFDAVCSRDPGGVKRGEST